LKIKIGIFVFLSVLLIIPFAQNSEGLGQTAGNLVYELQPGQSQTLQWGLLNSSEDGTITITLEVYGDGSDLVSIPKTIDLPRDEWVGVEITVTIPEDHPNDVYIGPRVSALQLPADTDAIIKFAFKVEKQLDVIIGNAVIPEVVAQPVPKQVEVQPEQEEEITEQEEEITEQEEPESTGGFTIVQSEEEGGGCLIATATYGSEMAQQVQLLREIRDDKLLSTSSGSSFMTGFNSLYYSFSPTIADLERQNPIFKEAVKLTITPLITSLSILNYVDMDSEAEVLGFGIGIISLNIGMYFVAPALIISRLRR